jgi:hypothetical protein
MWNATKKGVKTTNKIGAMSNDICFNVSFIDLMKNPTNLWLVDDEEKA